MSLVGSVGDFFLGKLGAWLGVLVVMVYVGLEFGGFFSVFQLLCARLGGVFCCFCGSNCVL